MNINLVRLFNLNRYQNQAIFILVIIAAIIINIVLSTISWRADFSQGQAYTLSQSTKNILKKNVDDIVNVKFYVSSDIPTRLLPLKNQVIDLLNEYKKENNKIRIQVLDPKKDQQTLNDAKNAGIPELQFSQLEQDKYAVSSVYFGVVLTYGSKKEVLPQVSEIESLEYNLTAAIYKLTNKNLASVGIVGESVDMTNPQTDPMATLKQVLSQQFTVDSVDVSTASAKAIDPKYKTLLILDNDQKSYDDGEVQNIKNYISKKGNVIFLVDGVWLGDNLTTTPSNSNLLPLIASYGVKVNNDFVLSTAAELVNFGSGNISYLSPYPFWIKTNSFNTKSSYFSNINQLTYPWVSSISLEKKNGVQTDTLVKSLKTSWEQKQNFVLDPQNIPPPQQKDLKEFIITAQVNLNNGGKIIVIPSSKFVQDKYLSQQTGNLELVLNMVNDLASNGALSGIRQRSINFYPLPDLGESQKDMFRYSAILLLPALFAIYGAWRLVKRK